jgi:deoxyribodipyrimidine photo-lyase
MTSLVWFRQDLRLADNLALQTAIKRGAVVPVFIYAPEEEAPWSPGGASRWWLHHSLVALDKSLRELGSQLIIRRGPSLEVLSMLAKEMDATAVFWNRRYEPAVTARDTKIKAALREGGLEVESFNGALLHEPWTIQNQSGKPFQVFTPFWKHCLTKPDPAAPLPRPQKVIPPPRWPKSLELDALELQPKIKWAEGLRGAWQPGESGANARLKSFLAAAFSNYPNDRNRPDLTGTSRLSPHLHFGEMSPRQIWYVVRRHAEAKGLSSWRKSQFLTEVGWREFAHHLLHHFPNTPAEPLRADFKKFPWRKDAEFLAVWQKGKTGYPIVDAGMRELWATGAKAASLRRFVAGFRAVWHDFAADPAGAAVLLDLLLTVSIAAFAADAAGHSLPAHPGRIYRVPHVAAVHHALPAGAECRLHAADFAQRLRRPHHPGVRQFRRAGNYVVGMVVFLILVLINFIVITKGAGRIAEVAARFTLDAMPGKQMAIDAELNAGLINETEARNRRRARVEEEADFYGAMDGASKFVRGDAIAAILITLINIVGGFAIGIMQKGMTMSEALQRFTMLSIGDGLVSQVPALITSVAAGILVTRATSKNDLGRELSRQLLFYPKALTILAVMLGIMAIVPGLPTLPFLTLAVLIGLLSYSHSQARNAGICRGKHPPATPAG